MLQLGHFQLQTQIVVLNKLRGFFNFLFAKCEQIVMLCEKKRSMIDLSQLCSFRQKTDPEGQRSKAGKLTKYSINHNRVEAKWSLAVQKVAVGVKPPATHLFFQNDRRT